MELTDRNARLGPEDRLDEHFATVYGVKQGRGRQRFPANTVTLFESAEAAIVAAQEGERLTAAVICGPSRSSENLELYYLIRWL